MKLIITESQLRLIVENEKYIDSNEKKLDLMGILNELKANENEIREVISYFAKKIVSFAAVKEFLENLRGIKELINTFDETNIDMAFQIMKGMKIKQSVILDEYKELFEIFKLKPSKLNLIKMASRREVYVGSSSSIPDILFKMPNLKGLGIDVNNLGNLTSFDGDLFLYSTGSQINSLPKLESVGGSLHLHTTSIKDLGDLKYVGGDLNLRRTPIESLGNLKSVGGNLDLAYSQIKTLGNLESVGGWLDLYNTPIESLGNLKSVGWSLNLRRTPIESLDDLKYVGSHLYLTNTPLSKTTTEEEIRKQITVKGNILL